MEHKEHVFFNVLLVFLPTIAQENVFPGVLRLQITLLIGNQGLVSVYALKLIQRNIMLTILQEHV